MMSPTPPVAKNDGPASGRPARRQALGMALAMGATAGLAWWAKPGRRLDASRPAVRLEMLFPARIGDWRQDTTPSSALVRPADEAGRLYGIYDQVLERIYIGPQGERLMLSVAYGTEQSVGLQVHRPEICYPGGGFKVSGLRRAWLPLPGRALPVTRLLATQPGRSEPITYWAVLGDTVEAGWGSFRWRQLSFGLRGQLLDGLLVRVSTLDLRPERAWETHDRFVAALLQSLGPAERLRVMGAAVNSPA
jgi:EpsI family protein